VARDKRWGLPAAESCLPYHVPFTKHRLTAFRRPIHLRDNVVVPRWLVQQRSPSTGTVYVSAGVPRAVYGCSDQ
jgi:hypothetical protein